MSIIADTLKRLQDPPTAATSEVPEEPSRRPTFNQGEGRGRHLKESPIKFWMIGLGLTLGLGGLALSAYWIGWHLDFGFSAKTYAGLPNSRSVVMTPSLSGIQEAPSTQSETLENRAVEPLLLSAPSSPDKQSTPPTTKAAIDSAANKMSPLAPPSNQPPKVLAQSDPLIASKSSAPQIQKASEELTEDDHEPHVPQTLNPAESEMLVELVHEYALEEEHPNIVEIEIEEAEIQKKPTPEIGILEEENVPMEEGVQIAKLAKKPTQAPPTFAGRIESPEKPNPKSIPRQPSPTSQLRHAQQLIRSGDYEDAVALLSPLFHDPPVQWQPWFWMGTALLGKGDMEQADQFFLSGLARNDKIPQLWIQRALVAQQRGDFQLAIHELRQAESLDADLPHIHLNMGYAYERLGNDRLANQYYGKFLKLSEGEPTFFSIRKKLFSRVTRQTLPEKPSNPTPPTP